MIPTCHMPAIFRCFVLFALLMTMQSANAQPPEASPEHTPEASPQQRQAHRPIVLAYIPSYKPAPVDQLAFDKLTHICHAFATVTPKGQFTTWEYMPDSKLVSQAHEHGVKVLLSLGGADSDHLLAPVAADDVKRNAFVDDVIDFMLKHHYDGVDVDWEFPDSKASAQGFIKLVKALSSKLNTLKQQTGRHYIMSRAVGGGWAYRNIPTEVFTNNFDFINVMGYDCAGPWVDIAAHHSPIKPASEAQGKDIGTVSMLLDHWRVERGIPASKLVLGLPAYGRGFKGAKRYGHVEKNSSAHTSYGYNELMQRASQGWTIKHLDNGEAWLIAPDQSEIIGFDDPAAITAKCQWAGELGLGGVFFWEGTQDIMPDGSTPLLDAAASAVAAWSTQP